jgi:hypothetical protein
VRTEPVSVYLRDRVLLRALAGARDTIPAAIVHEMMVAYLAANPSARIIAEAVEAHASGSSA